MRLALALKSYRVVADSPPWGAAAVRGAENSEVLPPGRMAVAVMFSPTATGLARATVKVPRTALGVGANTSLTDKRLALVAGGVGE